MIYLNRKNRNLSSNYYFYRDSKTHKVDVILKEGNQLIPIEIKASKTLHMEFLKGI